VPSAWGGFRHRWNVDKLRQGVVKELADAEAFVRLTRRQVAQVMDDEAGGVAHVGSACEHQVQAAAENSPTVRRQLQHKTDMHVMTMSINQSVIFYVA